MSVCHNEKSMLSNSVIYQEKYMASELDTCLQASVRQSICKLNNKCFANTILPVTYQHHIYIVRHPSTIYSE